jgi:hypothetical protein
MANRPKNNVSLVDRKTVGQSMRFYVEDLTVQKKADGKHDCDYDDDDEGRKRDTLAVEPVGIVTVAG